MLKSFPHYRTVSVALNSFINNCKSDVQYYKDLNKKHNSFRGTFCLCFSQPLLCQLNAHYQSVLNGL